MTGGYRPWSKFNRYTWSVLNRYGQVSGSEFGLNAHLASQQFVHWARIGDFEQLGALFVAQIPRQCDVADDVVAGFRFAAGIQLQIDLDIRHGDLPPGRDHLQRDGRAVSVHPAAFLLRHVS